MEKIHGKVHYAIKTLLPSIPQEEKDLFHVLCREFPHKRESLGAYIVYVKNLLQLIEYTPSLQHKILTLIFERMIELDVSAFHFYSIKKIVYNIYFIFCLDNRLKFRDKSMRLKIWRRV
jgi:hypothetical protein